MKSEKGITLIALIITIIVMLILVAVTVAVAVDGGIFRNASNAAKETEKKGLYETIASAMKLSNDGEILVSDTALLAKTTIEEEKNKQGQPERPTTISYGGDGGSGESGGSSSQLPADWYRLTSSELATLQSAANGIGTEEGMKAYNIILTDENYLKVVIVNDGDDDEFNNCMIGGDLIDGSDIYYIVGDQAEAMASSHLGPTPQYTWLINDDDNITEYAYGCAPIEFEDNAIQMLGGENNCSSYLSKIRTSLKNAGSSSQAPAEQSSNNGSGGNYAILTVQGKTGTYQYKISNTKIEFYREVTNSENGNNEQVITPGNEEVVIADPTPWYRFTDNDISELGENYVEAEGEAKAMGVNYMATICEGDEEVTVMILDQDNYIIQSDIYGMYFIGEDALALFTPMLPDAPGNKWFDWSDGYVNEYNGSYRYIFEGYHVNEQLVGELQYMCGSLDASNKQFDMFVDRYIDSSDLQINSISYYKRLLKNTFNYTSQWYDYTITEFAQIYTRSGFNGNGIRYAYKSTSPYNLIDLYNIRNENPYLEISVDGDRYFYYIKGFDIVRSEYESGVWYIGTPGNGTPTKYTGSSPIDLNSFGSNGIKCERLVQAVIDSFSGN